MDSRAVTEIQRGRILAAAIQAIYEVGYAQMTVAQIISRARVSRKTFYLVFRDREECFLAAFDMAIDRARVVAVEAYRREVAWRDAVRSALAALLVFLDEEPALAQLLVVAALGAGSMAITRRTAMLDELAGVIDRGRAEAAGPVAPLTAEGVVGAILGVLHTRLVRREEQPLRELLGPLMSIVVLPYVGAGEADSELERTLPDIARSASPPRPSVEGPLDGLRMRLTYRTVRVLMALQQRPGASNREIAERADIADQGQISKLLTRLAGLGLIVNSGEGPERGMSNSWHLTDRGAQIERATRLR
jgi:AcrR family transcriptional regulator/DNA-binding MarR family transcriptional regulator